MTACQMMMLGVGGTVRNPVSGLATNTAAGSGTSTAQIAFNNDGTMQGSLVYTGPTNWYTPTTAGIGNQYWMSVDSGAWQSMSSGILQSITGGNLSVSRNIRIATDSGGTNIVATGSINLQVSNGV